MTPTDVRIPLASGASIPVAAPPRWLMLHRFVQVAAVELVGEQHGDIYVGLQIREPPGLSTVLVPTSMHPNPADHDEVPYVLAADTAVLLLHIKRRPFVDTDNFNPRGDLFVVQVSLQVHGNVLVPDGDAIRLPNCANRPVRPPITHLKHVGVVSVPGSCGADFIVAELQTFYQSDHALLVYFRSGAPMELFDLKGDGWAEKKLPLPLADIPGGGEILKFHEVVPHDGKLWWVNLRQGILSCDPFDDHPVLRYTALPETAIPIGNQHQSLDIEKNRFVRPSHGSLRYVEMVRAASDRPEATMVVMRSLEADVGGGGLMWSAPVYATRIGEIWASDGYKNSRMPEEVPVLGAVHPSNPDVLYFFVRRFIFGVEMREPRVVHIRRGYDLLNSSPFPPYLWRNALVLELIDYMAETDDMATQEASNAR